MKKFWLALLVFISWTIIMLLFHQFFDNNLVGVAAKPEQLDKKLPANETSNTVLNAAFAIRTNDGAIRYQFDDPIITNSSNGELQLSDQLVSLKDSVYDYLNNHQDQEMLIRVKYLASEVDSANTTHFGNERVNNLKNMLIAGGINPKKLFFETLPAEYSYDKNGHYTEGIEMSFKAISDEHNRQIEADIRNKTLYADFAQAEFKPDRTLVAYTLELKNYLAKESGKTIVVTGHTDSVGVNNYQWGLDRANNVKNYLVSQGISPSMIKVISKGESQPIASNLAEEGRAKNRRIVITVN